MTPTPNHHPDPARGADEEKAVRTHLLCAVALGVSALAGAAAAQDSDTVTVQSTVAPYCQSLSGLPTGPLALGQLADGVGQVVDTFAGSTSVSLANYYCNAPTTIELEARPLRVSPWVVVSDDTSFTAEVHYVASLTWSDVSGSDNSVDAGATDITASTAKIGNLVVSVADPSTEGNRRPIAGAYEGSVVLNISTN